MQLYLRAVVRAQSEVMPEPEERLEVVPWGGSGVSATREEESRGVVDGTAAHATTYC